MSRDVPAVARLLILAWREIKGEDLDYWVDETAPNGEVFRISAAESLMLCHIRNGCRIQIAEVAGDIVGILIYSSIFSRVVAVWMFFLLEDHRNLRVGKGFFDSLGSGIKRIIYQRLKSDSPQKITSIRYGKRSKVCEDDERITWEMEWGG